MVEFALVAPLAVLLALAVAQFALFLYERNVVMGSLSEGARVAAASGRTVSDGERAAGNLLREALGGRIAVAVSIRGAVESGLVVLRADATLPSFVPGVPGLEVHMTAAMHKEESLAVQDEPQVAPAGAVGARSGVPAGPPGPTAAPGGDVDASGLGREPAGTGREPAAMEGAAEALVGDEVGG